MPDEKFTQMVREMQLYLNAHANAGLDPDGKLGGKTLKAAQVYQRSFDKTPPMPSRGWRLAPALAILRGQIDHAHPDRSKVADGTIGDAAHAARKSDHNPDSAGIVHALDITHDPDDGVDCAKIAEQIKTDPRVSYVIFRGRIFNPTKAVGWRLYTGADAHNHHMHVSIKAGTFSSDTREWKLP